MANNKKKNNESTVGMYIVKKTIPAGESLSNYSDLLDMIEILDDAIYHMQNYSFHNKWKNAIKRAEIPFITPYLSQIAEVIKTSCEDFQLIEDIEWLCNYVRINCGHSKTRLLFILVGEIRKKAKLAKNAVIYKKVLLEILDKEINKLESFRNIMKNQQDNFYESIYDDFSSESFNSDYYYDERPKPNRSKPIAPKQRQVHKKLASQESKNYSVDVKWLREKLIDVEDNLIKLLKLDFLKEEIAILFLILINNKINYQVIAETLELSASQINAYKTSLLEKLKRHFNIDIHNHVNSHSDIDFNVISAFYNNKDYDTFVNENHETLHLFTDRELRLLKRYFNFIDEEEIKRITTLPKIEKEINMSYYRLYRRQARLTKDILKQTYLNNKNYFSERQSQIIEHYLFGKYNELEFQNLTGYIKKPHTHKTYCFDKIERIFFNIYRKNLKKETVETILNDDKNIFTDYQRKLLCMKFGIGYDKPRTIPEIAEILEEKYVKVHDAYMNAKDKIINFLYDVSTYCRKKDTDDLLIYLDDSRYDLNDRLREILNDHIIFGMSYKELREKYKLKSDADASNKVNDGIRYLKFYRYGIDKILIVDETELNEFFQTMNYSEKEKRIIKLIYIERMEKQDIETLLKIYSHNIGIINNKFIIDFIKFKYNEKVCPEDILKEIGCHVSDRVLDNEELSLLCMKFGIKSEFNSSGQKYSIKDINSILKIKSGEFSRKYGIAITKLLKRKIGILDPEYGIISRDEMINILADTRIPLSDEEKEIICHLKGINGYELLSTAQILEKYKKSNSYLKRMYKRAILKIKEYQYEEIGKKYDFDKDLEPIIKYFPFEHREIIKQKYKYGKTDKEIARKVGKTIDQIRHILKQVRLSIIAIRREEQDFRKTDYDYYNSVINNNDLPVFGNVILKKKVASMYLGLNGYKIHTVPEIIKSLNLKYNLTTLRKFISDVILGIEKYKYGIKMEFSCTYRDLMLFYETNKETLSKSEIMIIGEYLSALKGENTFEIDDIDSEFEDDEIEEQNDIDDFVNIMDMPNSLVYKIISFKKAKKVNLSEIDKDEVITLLHSNNLHINNHYQRSLRYLFNINEREFMSNADKQKTMKLLTRVYLNRAVTHKKLSFEFD